MMARVAHQLEPPVAFRADHPFVFYITAKLNGNSRNILFMGKIVVPNLN